MCASYLWARATRGNIPFEELKSCYPCRPDDVMSTAHGVMAEGLWHAYHGRTGEELAAFERSRGDDQEEPLYQLAYGRRDADAGGRLPTARGHRAGRGSGQERQLRRRALRAGTVGARITRLFPGRLPLSLRELALSLAANGKTRQALRAVDRSLAVAERQQAHYEHAQSLLVRGHLAQQLGLPEADQQIRAAETAARSPRTPGARGHDSS